MKTTHPHFLKQITGIALAGSIALQAAHAGSVAIISDATPSYGNITGNLQTRELAVGNTVSIFSSVPTDLSPYNQVWDLRYKNTTPLTTGEQTQYLNYLQSGKSMFVMGENSGFATRDNSIFSLVSLAGGGTLTLSPTTPNNTQQIRSC